MGVIRRNGKFQADPIPHIAEAVEDERWEGSDLNRGRMLVSHRGHQPFTISLAALLANVRRGFWRGGMLGDRAGHSAQTSNGFLRDLACGDG